jgi:hydroxymethylglutaryl-CoA reductase
MTHAQVAAVRVRRERQAERYAAIFEAMDELGVAGAAALQSADYAELGALMNICQGLLNAIEVSTPEIESLVSMARSAGAAGAKLTGAGGGGAVAILCPGAEDAVVATLAAAGVKSLRLVSTEA